MVRGPSLEEDLKQEGALALLKAAEQFDLILGNRFLTYATPAIQAAMRDCAARSTLPLTVPAGRYHQLRQVLRRRPCKSLRPPDAEKTAFSAYRGGPVTEGTESGALPFGDRSAGGAGYDVPGAGHPTELQWLQRSGEGIEACHANTEITPSWWSL